MDNVQKFPQFTVVVTEDSTEFHIDSSMLGYLTHALLQARPSGSFSVYTPKGALRVHVHATAHSNPPPAHNPIEEK